MGQKRRDNPEPSGNQTSDLNVSRRVPYYCTQPMPIQGKKHKRTIQSQHF